MFRADRSKVSAVSWASYLEYFISRLLSLGLHSILVKQGPVNYIVFTSSLSKHADVKFRKIFRNDLDISIIFTGKAETPSLLHFKRHPAFGAFCRNSQFGFGT